MATQRTRRTSKRTPAERPPIELTDPRAIRALAHPARLAVLEELYSAGAELTATECAEHVGLSPSAMSYHLRSLERAGIVERAPTTGDGRERPWRAAGPYLQIKPGAGAAALAASAAFTHSVLGRTLADYDDWMSHRSAEDESWRETGGSSFSTAWLTAAECERLQQRFLDELREYRDRPPDQRPAGARRTRVTLLVVPLRGRQ